MKKVIVNKKRVNLFHARNDDRNTKNPIMANISTPYIGILRK